ncbi:MAG TPA: alkaline phosphatase family protein, partial [Conexibacter sp.]|nr:alkaline phosphatase family protein [Conexibacter sp.]
VSPRRRAERAAYARRRRAALPCALAAFVALVVATTSNIPASFAGATVPSLTVVLPPTLVAAATPADESPASADASDAAPADTRAPVDTSSPQPTRHHKADGGSHPDPSGTDVPSIHHVFLIVLADTDLTTLGSDTAPYLTGTLRAKGTLLTDYVSAARGAVANGVALISGQGPTAQTLAGCPTFADVTPDTVGADGQQLGDGCVYPYATGTIADELHANGLDWRAYLEGAGSACRHPAVGAPDPLPAPTVDAAYATQRNPFAYFHSLIDAGGTCASDDVDLDALDADLARGAHAPALSYIVPDRCHDGSAVPCAPGAPAGAAAADAFLAGVVPRILASPAWADGALLAITSDQPPPPPPAAPPPPTTTPTTPQTTPTQTTPAPPPATTTPTQTTPAQTTSAPSATAAAAPSVCCEPPTYPNVGDAAAAGAGRVGALLIGPGVRRGVTDAAPASHFTLLRTISDLFTLQPLGYAGAAALVPLPARVVRRRS